MRCRLSSKIATFVLVLLGSFLILNSLHLFEYSSNTVGNNNDNNNDNSVENHNNYQLNRWNLAKETSGDDDGEIDKDRVALLKKLFVMTNAILDFFERDFEQLNLDALYGVRIAEGRNYLEIL